MNLAFSKNSKKVKALVHWGVNVIFLHMLISKTFLEVFGPPTKNEEGIKQAVLRTLSYLKM
jgi:hypothetical protein